MKIPFFRPEIAEAEIEEVVACLRSGWLTTGPRVSQLEEEFRALVGVQNAVAVSSCTAALHLAVDALGLEPGQAVLVPTWTFAATAEVVRYQGATPILVDCDAKTFQIDLLDAERKLDSLKAGTLLNLPSNLDVVGMIVVHVGGAMLNLDHLAAFSARHGLWVVEDAAHAFPSSWRRSPAEHWRRCGAGTSSVTCYSFYANKPITTGEGGMAVTNDQALARRMRTMSLHGLSHDAWERYSGGRSWDYQIVAPGFKYNLSDIHAAIGIHQLRRAEEMREAREQVAIRYNKAFLDQASFQCPSTSHDRIDSWHLFPIRLNLARWKIDRNGFIDALREAEVGCSVHWRPLHLHPYYAEDAYRWTEADFPQASSLWPRVVSLPIFSGQTDAEVDRVIDVVLELARRHGQ